MIFISRLIKRIGLGRQDDYKWNKTMRWLMLAIVFLLPIFFLMPNTFPLELNKVILFNILVLVTAAIFLLKIIIFRQGSLVKSFLDWPILGIAVFTVISFIASANHYYSLVGVSGYYSASVVTTLCFILFFYLLLNVVKNRDDIFCFLTAFLDSAALAVIYNILQVNGLYILPWENTQSAVFDLIAGSSASLAVYAAIVSFIGFGLFLYFRPKVKKIVFGGLTLLSLALLFFLDKDIAFFPLALAIFFLLILITFRSKQLSSWWVVLPTVFLTIIVLFIFINASSLISTEVRQSVFLDHRTSAVIAWESFTQAPLWGSGPQTFTYDFNEYRPAEFNNTDLWSLRFIKGSNEWFGVLASLGLGGLAAWLSLGIWFLIRGIKRVLTMEKADQDWRLGIIILVSWLIVFIISFIMPFNFILHFLWWFLLAMGLKALGLASAKEKSFSLDKSALARIISLASFVIIAAGTVLVILFGVRIYLGDYNFARAQQAINQKQTVPQIEKYLQRAINHNPYEVQYYISLAQGYATQVQLMAMDPAGQTADIQQLTQQIINNLKQAKETDPNNPVVHEQSAALYDGLRNIITNVDELSEQAYAKAVELELTSPLALLNLGRARMFWAQILLVNEDETVKVQGQKLIELAINNFQQASSLKSDFAIADLNIGYAYKTAGDLEKALATFHNILIVEPGVIEAHWQIALIYEEQAKIAEAVTQLQSALELDPGNAVIQAKIEALGNLLEEGNL